MKRLSCFSSVAVVTVAGLALVGLLLAWCALTGTSSASAVQPRAGQGGPVAQVSASSEFTVCTASGGQWLPAIYGDVVVWEDWRGTDTDIYGYDLSTGQEFTVCTASGDQWYPAIYGDVVVWYDDRGAVSDIYGYDLSTGQEFAVYTATGWQYNPAIYGDVVVWIDLRGGHYDIYGYDLSTGQEFTVCTASGDQGNPAIYGDVVVWSDGRGTDGDIYGYDLSTGQEFTVCTASGEQANPAIYGDVVVWEDDRGPEPPSIYGYDLSTGQEFTVCTALDDQYQPAIYGDVVVWRDGRGPEPPSIYGRRLGFGGPHLDVVKRASSAVVHAGEQLTYTIRVTNTGAVSLTATITDVLPDHVTPSGVLTWTPTISPASPVWTETVVVTVDVGYAGPLTNVVQVTTAEGATGTYTETSEAQVIPKLEVTKRANTSSVQAGEQLTYTIRVTNTGNIDLHATVTDVLPSHVTFTGPLTWTPTISAPGGVWEQTVVVTVETGYSGGLTNTVQVSTEEGAVGSDTETCTSVGGYDVFLPLVLRNSQ